jgi:hypothetical protein
LVQRQFIGFQSVVVAVTQSVAVIVGNRLLTSKEE